MMNVVRDIYRYIKLSPILGNCKILNSKKLPLNVEILL